MDYRTNSHSRRGSIAFIIFYRSCIKYPPCFIHNLYITTPIFHTICVEIFEISCSNGRLILSGHLSSYEVRDRLEKPIALMRLVEKNFSMCSQLISKHLLSINLVLPSLNHERSSTKLSLFLDKRLFQARDKRSFFLMKFSNVRGLYSHCGILRKNYLSCI